MKLVIFRLSIALATLAIGLGIVTLTNQSSVVSLCDIQAHPGAYAGKVARVHTYMYVWEFNWDDGLDKFTLEDGTRQAIIAGCACKPGNPANAIVGVRSDIRNQGVISDPPNSLIEVRMSHVSEVVISGLVEQVPDGPLGGWSIKISDAKVERIIAVKEFMDSEEAWNFIGSNSL